MEWIGEGLLGHGIGPNASKRVSETLLAAGIKGIRYLDGMSRGQGEGSYNYVIFDENDIEILEENGKPVTVRTLTPRGRIAEVEMDPDEARDTLAATKEALEGIEKWLK